MIGCAMVTAQLQSVDPETGEDVDMLNIGNILNLIYEVNTKATISVYIIGFQK